MWAIHSAAMTLHRLSEINYLPSLQIISDLFVQKCSVERTPSKDRVMCKVMCWIQHISIWHDIRSPKTCIIIRISTYSQYCRPRHANISPVQCSQRDQLLVQYHVCTGGHRQCPAVSCRTQTWKQTPRSGSSLVASCRPDVNTHKHTSQFLSLHVLVTTSNNTVVCATEKTCSQSVSWTVVTTSVNSATSTTNTDISHSYQHRALAL